MFNRCRKQWTGLDNMLPLHLTGSVCISIMLGFTSALRGPTTVHGFVGRSLPVMCHYDNIYKENSKYWCKGDWSTCTKVVETGGSEEEVKASRTSIKDNHTCSCFTVTLEDLREEDAGTYWCAVDKSWIDLGVEVTVVPEPLPSTTTVVVTTGYSPAIHTPTRRLIENPTRLYLPIGLLVLLLVLLVGGLLVVWRLKKKTAAKSHGYILQSTVPKHAEGNVSNAARGTNDRPNDQTPSPSSDQDLNSTLHVEYTSVKRPPVPSTQSQVPSTNTEDVSYATIKFPAQDEQAIYANLK